MTIDASRAHIDAETLAAWVDRGLPTEAADAVELHLSHCDRCQEVLAAFIRSEPVEAPVVAPFWSRRPVKWGAAGLAAAAAVLAFVWIGLPPAVPVPDSTVARAPVDTLSPSIPVPKTPSPSASPLQRRADKPAAAAEQRETKAVAAPPPPTPLPASASTGVAGGRAVAQAPVPPPPPAAVASAPPASQFSAVSESLMRDKPGVFVVVAPDPAPAVTGQAASADAARRAGRGGAGAARGSAFQSTSATLWRVVEGRRVERSTNAGSTWTVLPVTPALTSSLVAGSATSPFVCWFVGDQGVVLVTTDGRTLRRVSLPEAVRLVAVTAVDGSQATVTTVDGRKFMTLDGGLTWKLQDFQTPSF